MASFVATCYRDPWRAIVAGSFLLAFPVVHTLGYASVAVITLTRGRYWGAVGALVLGCVAVYCHTSSQLPPEVLPWRAGFFCFSLWMSAGVLRQTVSMNLSLHLLAVWVMVCYSLLAALGALPDSDTLRHIYQEQIRLLGENHPSLTPSDLDILRQFERVWVYSLAVVNVLELSLLLLFARWVQAAIFNPGGFGREFRSLRMDKWYLFLTVALGLGAVWSKNYLLILLSTAACALGVVAGTSLVHSMLRRHRLSFYWLLLFYFLLFFFSLQFAPWLMALASADVFFNWREKKSF